MQFTKRLRPGIRRGEITCTVRIWTTPRVKVGGRYKMEEGEVVVDSMRRIERDDLTPALARRSGFDDVEALLKVAQHGAGSEVYLIEFHYVGSGQSSSTRLPLSDRAPRARARAGEEKASRRKEPRLRTRRP